MNSPQYRFIDSKGQPVEVDGNSVVQLDRIPIDKGTVVITFLSAPGAVQCGVALKSKKGEIVLSNDSKVKLLLVWNLPSLPTVISHKVRCPNHELLVWNIYKASSNSEPTQADYWTGNSGMIVENVGPNTRRYFCSHGLGDFNKTDLTFTLSWGE